MNHLARLDHTYLWHPFTQMCDWLKREPIVIHKGKGAVLEDTRGRTYLDANSSIWTNLHGHRHPAIDRAIRQQLGKIAHSSALGLSNEPASLLGRKLVQSAQPSGLRKVFYSDDGSTAVEVAIKLAYEYTRRTGQSQKPRFLSLQAAYHGDTVGATSVGHIDLFHSTFRGLLFRSDKAMAPYCYRCRFNRAKPDRADAREYRRCNWECLDSLESQFKRRKKTGNGYSGFIFEPLIQGAAGMIPQPHGWLSRAAEIARSQGALLIADEVMTGFGRTGTGPDTALSRKAPNSPPDLFACGHEGVAPDFLALAKGLTGGYLPMAATLATQPVFDAFLGEYHQFKTFFHGHSYTANQLGAAAALANLKLLEDAACISRRRRLERALREQLASLWSLPHVGDIRQVGLIAGIELVKNWRTREAFDLSERAGMRVCEAMASQGVLTRPIGNVIVVMPPYCTSLGQLAKIVGVLRHSLQSTFSGRTRASARGRSGMT
jgi:adenosylmethionine---8-amino-7-oxononanoate aminotransferase